MNQGREGVWKKFAAHMLKKLYWPKKNIFLWNMQKIDKILEKIVISSQEKMYELH